MDHYETLGVNKNASRSEIKKAYKKQANKTHPDKKRGNTEKHQALTVAYSVLVDTEKRERYDRGENPTQGAPANKAEQFLIRLFEQLLGEEFKGNLIKEATARVIQAQVGSSRKIGQEKQRVGALAGKLGRIQTEAKDNFFESLLAQKIQTSTDAIAHYEEELQALRETVDILEGCSDTKPDEQPVAPFGHLDMRHLPIGKWRLVGQNKHP